MRLLKCDNDGKLSLTEFFDDIPPYAILSHTWGPEEVTFRDMMERTRASKTGFYKIQFCGQQARHDGLHYFWVDTCCIDKSSSAELAEAINSMFRRYQNAVKCYVYLSDVSTKKRKASDSFTEYTWEPAFRSSKWFTRGWTLQELIAPTLVEFFSKEWEFLGDKKSLERPICEITRIPSKALRGRALADFSTTERMSWAATRQTTREEDRAYSLLGIFGIYMPLIYGEGAANALKRLQDEIDKNSRPGQDPSFLDRLPYAVEAPFNSYAKQHEPICLPNTRVDLLQVIYNWANGQDERSIFWLNGSAGTGKSTIARTVARHYFDAQRLGASFFFSRGGEDVRHASKFATSIAVQLATSIPALRRYIDDAVTERSNIASRSLPDQWHELVLGPLSRLDGNGDQPLYILVVDALDECDDEYNIRILLHLLAQVRSLKRVRLRVFLTSRPEIPIRHGFCQIPDREYEDFLLNDISPPNVDHDLTIFLEYNFKDIRQERSLDAGWPGEENVKKLVYNACGLFIWAATACRFIREGKRFAARRLNTILMGSGSAVTEPEKHLDEIYTTVLYHSVYREYTEEEKKESYRMLRQILGSIVILFAPLSVHSLHKLLHMTKEDVNQTLEDLHSVINIPKDHTRALRLHHPSFRNFLLSNDRCRDASFWVDEKQAHQRLVDNCLQLLLTYLRKDICEVDAPGMLATRIESSRVEQCLPLELQYACLYWIQHLQKSGAQLHDHDQVHRFLREHFLHWFEALGWIGKVSEGIHAIGLLESFASSSDSPGLSTFVHDAKRFVLYNQTIIEQAPLQTYYSALVFAPTTSIIRKQFKDYIPRWVRRLPKVKSHWDALLQALEGHSRPVYAVVFSPDGKTLASGSWDNTVKLWDASSGELLYTLEGHLGIVMVVAFSPDGKTLASPSEDKTVKLWDTGSGALLQTLKGHSNLVEDVAFSPDGKTLASASDDNTVKLWDPGLGTLLQTLEGHSNRITTIAFSPDGKMLASASEDNIVKLWDTSLGAPLQAHKCHSDLVIAMAFSPDGKMLASASMDNTVKLWDASSGEPLQTLEGHSESVVDVAFSPDGKTLASTSYDKTVKLWDSGSSAMLQTLNVDSTIDSFRFSDDGSFLRTNRGLLYSTLLSSCAALSGSNLSPPIFIGECWVNQNGERLLWLPSEYRASCVAVQDGIVAFGYRSGRVLIMEFTF